MKLPNLSVIGRGTRTTALRGTEQHRVAPSGIPGFGPALYYCYDGSWVCLMQIGAPHLGTGWLVAREKCCFAGGWYHCYCPPGALKLPKP